MNHILKVGSILASSWGYDQTNVTFYEVIALNGKTMATLREIAQQVVRQGGMQGLVRPLPGEFRGAPMRKKVRTDGYIRIEDWEYARPTDPDKAHFFSSYA